RPLYGPNSERLGFAELGVVVQVNVGRPSRARLVTMAAVDMQIRPCPLLERDLGVVRIGHPARRGLHGMVRLAGRCAREAEGSHVLERGQWLSAHRAVI